MVVARILLVMILFASPGRGFPEELSAQKRADIEKLLEMTGALALGRQMSDFFVTRFTQGLRQTYPDIPQQVLDVLPEEVDAVVSANMDDLKAGVIPIYHKHFTGRDIEEMIEFYSTPLGQKTIRLLPVLMSESMQVGEQWGRSLAPAIEQQVKARLRKEGYGL
ncbi:MAG: DUF2059 domain-containing protein [Burkholderiales bacterium]|nr:DUF2059 domain-containing protein [Burkholderiales bacterium]